MSTLKEQAQRFHTRLQSVKRETPLEPNLAWYPWTSLGQFDILDGFLKSDVAQLLRLIGPDPVLDIGCGDGDIAFFLESLGAQVNVLDHAPTNYNALYGVRALKQKLSSGVGIHALDIDAATQLPGGPYGFSVLLGILYHLKNPFLVLETLARHSRYVFLSTRIAELAPDRTTSFGGNPVAYLVDEDELNQDYTNYWIFTEAGLRRIVRRAGWEIVHYQAAGPAPSSDPVSPQGDARAYILAKSRLAPALGEFRRTTGWHEVEHGAWQWSSRRFAVEASLADFRPGSQLRFLFYLPEPVFAGVTSITLSARLRGETETELPAATYTKSGEQQFVVPLPALQPGKIVIEFQLSSAIVPSDQDRRELGLQVNLTGRAPVTLT